ncbi:hypothetical protein ZIOFF_004738 [Zingiber officinale]|uniref:MPN domain-containing protein n=1 Tax=Zingiber officinale TaxID=94328 RepID=A0A8J5M3X1_ZINOF|nr:hypothetical protein ZIOFF_004738 [Zingiber officinale]
MQGMERLHRIFSGAGGMGHPPTDSPQLDSAEQVYISSLALLKMLKHGRAGVPMEVMGLMLGEFVDEYTVRVVDVFAMPQSGTGVSVEAVDHICALGMNLLHFVHLLTEFVLLIRVGVSAYGSRDWQVLVHQHLVLIPDTAASGTYLVEVALESIDEMKFGKAVLMTLNILMLDYLATNVEKGNVEPFPTFGGFAVLVNYALGLVKGVIVCPHGPEMVVGWYHSHPGFGCWLSGVDINTQQSFEALNPRAIAVVVDPIQSVKGKVVIDAFRLINPQTMMLGQEPRQTTSNVGHLNKPSIQALIHGLNRHYYSIAINYRKNELEEKMLLNLHKKKWTDGLILRPFDTHSKTNEQTVQEMLDLAIKYNKAVQEEDELPPEKLAIANVGRQDAKKHLEEHVSNLMSSNIIQTLGTMLDTVVF